jgi:hypothetical protein
MAAVVPGKLNNAGSSGEHFPMKRACLTLLLAAACLLQACGQGTASIGTPAPATGAQRITFDGVGALGIFDPSVTRDPDTGRLWMSYSEVGISANAAWGVGIRLAWSDNGRDWIDAGLVSPFHDVTVGPLTTLPGEPAIPASTPGTGQSAAGERWKLLWFQVLWANNQPYFTDYSWIAMKAAATPADLVAATPVKLFSGYLASSDGEANAAPAYAPIGGPAEIALETRDPELAHCVFAEPGLVATASGLFLSIDCQSVETSVVPYVTLLSCSYPGCDVTAATNWHYIGRVLAPADAQAVSSQYKGYSASALAEQDGDYYLLATPVDTTGDRYDGCRVFRFTDLASGTLARVGGLPLTVAQVTGLSGSHHGACAHHAALANGILLSQVDTAGAPAVFRVFASGITFP